LKLLLIWIIKKSVSFFYIYIYYLHVLMLEN
jgi:hypothetical protein